MKQMMMMNVFSVVAVLVLASGAEAKSRKPAQAGTGSEIGNRGEGMQKREISGIPAKRMIKALDAIGIESVGTAGKQTYTVQQLGCISYSNKFGDPNSRDYGVATYECSVPKILPGSTAKGLVMAMGLAGVDAEHAAGGKALYEIWSLECIIHGPVQGDGHYTCSFESADIE